MSEQDYPLENQFDIIHVPCSAHLAFVSKDLVTGVLFYICPVCHRKFAFGELTEPEDIAETGEGQPEPQPEPQAEKKPRKRRKQPEPQEQPEPQADQPEQSSEKSDNADNH